MIVYDESGHLYVNLSGTADISPQAEMLEVFFIFPTEIKKPARIYFLLRRYKLK